LDPTFQNHLAAPPLTDLLSDGTNDTFVRRALHKLKGLSNLLIWHETEKRGLLKLHSQSLFQRVVEYWITRGVVEVRQDRDVFVGQPSGEMLLRPVAGDPESNSSQECSKQKPPPAMSIRDFAGCGRVHDKVTGCFDRSLESISAPGNCLNKLWVFGRVF